RVEARSSQTSERAGERERSAEEVGGRFVLGQGDFEGGRLGKLLSPAKRRAAVNHVRQVLGPEQVSERRACQVLGQLRCTQRRVVQIPNDEPQLVREMTALATQYGRYGYRRITALLQHQ